MLCMHDKLPPKGVCLDSRDLFKFWEVSDNTLLTVQDTNIVAMENTNRKSYAAYRMEPLPMSLNDFEGHFFSVKPF